MLEHFALFPWFLIQNWPHETLSGRHIGAANVKLVKVEVEYSAGRPNVGDVGE